MNSPVLNKKNKLSDNNVFHLTHKRSHSETKINRFLKKKEILINIPK